MFVLEHDNERPQSFKVDLPQYFIIVALGVDMHEVDPLDPVFLHERIPFQARNVFYDQMLFDIGNTCGIFEKHLFVEST